jgi:hypothetical protein
LTLPAPKKRKSSKPDTTWQSRVEIMTEATDLGRIDHSARTVNRLAGARALLPLGWVLATIGYYGPWIGHATAALTLSGGDMAEFVKFLPGVLAGTLGVVRHFFYLPPLAVVSSVALLIASNRLAYPWLLRFLALLLCVPLSLQMLPPAWSPASLATPEFRLQAIGVALCWLMLAASWLLARLPAWFSGPLTAGLSLAAGAFPAWQLAAVKPAIDAVYGTPPALGWGMFLCLTGLALLALAGAILALPIRRGDVGLWTSR